MKNKGSLAWLIIFLAVIIFGLAWLIGYNKHLQIVTVLRNEVDRLNQELEKATKEQKFEIQPSPASTTSAELDTEISTESAEGE